MKAKELKEKAVAMNREANEMWQRAQSLEDSGQEAEPEQAEARPAFNRAAYGAAILAGVNAQLAPFGVTLPGYPAAGIAASVYLPSEAAQTWANDAAAAQIARYDLEVASTPTAFGNPLIPATPEG